MTIDELSDKLQIGKSTIYRWIHYEFIQHYKLGGVVRFRQKDVEKWLVEKENVGEKIFILKISIVLSPHWHKL